MLRLRRRRSFRGRFANSLDRSIGWIIVTLVGVISALIAFLIVRAEQWLFDVKEGFCGDAWWKAKRFCCPSAALGSDVPLFVVSGNQEHICSAWKLWGDVLGPKDDGNSPWAPLQDWATEYLTYTVIAVLISSVLYIRNQAEATLLIALARLYVVHADNSSHGFYFIYNKERFWRFITQF